MSLLSLLLNKIKSNFLKKKKTCLNWVYVDRHLTKPGKRTNRIRLLEKLVTAILNNGNIYGLLMLGTHNKIIGLILADFSPSHNPR